MFSGYHRFPVSFGGSLFPTRRAFSLHRRRVLPEYHSLADCVVYGSHGGIGARLRGSQGTFHRTEKNDSAQETVVKKMKAALHGIRSVCAYGELVITALPASLHERSPMKHNAMKTVLAVAVLAAAGCATPPSTSWEFRYEDRDKIAAVAAKIETAAADLQEWMSQPESLAISDANTAAKNSIRTFAAEAGQFLRAVRVWRPGQDITLDYTFLRKHWNAAERASSNQMSSEETKARIKALDVMMDNLYGLAIHDSSGPVKIGT
ncbi:MAG: hypothetical protein HZC54_01640 [Verrucomicrobia bacterium]|nr:hypothetical protein [Verrucomicrobiota bacterium]